MSERRTGHYEILVRERAGFGQLEFIASSAGPDAHVLYRGRFIAKFDRLKLQEWLRHPTTPLEAGGVELSFRSSGVRAPNIIITLHDDITCVLTVKEWRKLAAAM